MPLRDDASRCECDRQPNPARTAATDNPTPIESSRRMPARPTALIPAARLASGHYNPNDLSSRLAARLATTRARACRSTHHGTTPSTSLFITAPPPTFDNPQPNGTTRSTNQPYPVHLARLTMPSQRQPRPPTCHPVRLPLRADRHPVPCRLLRHPVPRQAQPTCRSLARHDPTDRPSLPPPTPADISSTPRRDPSDRPYLDTTRHTDRPSLHPPIPADYARRLESHPNDTPTLFVLYHPPPPLATDHAVGIPPRTVSPD